MSQKLISDFKTKPRYNGCDSFFLQSYVVTKSSTQFYSSLSRTDITISNVHRLLLQSKILTIVNVGVRRRWKHGGATNVVVDIAAVSTNSRENVYAGARHTGAGMQARQQREHYEDRMTLHGLGPPRCTADFNRITSTDRRDSPELFRVNAPSTPEHAPLMELANFRSSRRCLHPAFAQHPRN